MKIETIYIIMVCFTFVVGCGESTPSRSNSEGNVSDEPKAVLTAKELWDVYHNLSLEKIEKLGDILDDPAVYFVARESVNARRNLIYQRLVSGDGWEIWEKDLLNTICMSRVLLDRGSKEGLVIFPKGFPDIPIFQIGSLKVMNSILLNQIAEAKPRVCAAISDLGSSVPYTGNIGELKKLLPAKFVSKKLTLTTDSFYLGKVKPKKELRKE